MRLWYQLSEKRVQFWQHPILWCVVVVVSLLAVISLFLGLWSVLILWLGIGAMAIRLIYRDPKAPTFKH